jgi:hypothetical protein
MNKGKKEQKDQILCKRICHLTSVKPLSHSKCYKITDLNTENGEGLKYSFLMKLQSKLHYELLSYYRNQRMI